MPKPQSPIVRSPALDRRILEYVLACVAQSDSYWQDGVAGTGLSRKGLFDEYRARYDARRSVACLDRDVKLEPWADSSNIGIGAEQIFGEFLIPLLLANTYDLEPMLQAVDRLTRKVQDEATAFHDHYHRIVLANKRTLLEESNREVLKVGGVYHKWTWGSVWRQDEIDVSVYVHPLTKQPLLTLDPGTGQLTPIIADPKRPESEWPTDPETGKRAVIASLKGVNQVLQREGPTLSLRPYESVGFPPNATQVDPQEWDYLFDRFSVSPWWFLGREGDPFDGKLQNVQKLWQWLGVRPDEVHKQPDGRLTKPVNLVEFHGKYPATADGQPVELIALVVPEANLLLAWRLSNLPRRPYFNRQVWSRGSSPLGKGIPETCYGLRAALDASVNQDIDAGNLYNHPPMLLSSLAMLEDEDYENIGVGTQLVMRDINGAKFLSPPISQRNPMERENWLLSMLQRQWGVTDVSLGAPTQSLSPQLDTARGAMIVHTNSNIKFGHLTKRLSETDSQEYTFVHRLFAKLLANPFKVAVDGQVIEIGPQNREEFFNATLDVLARGNGLSTNPMLRQQVHSQFYPLALQNQYIGGDLEVWKDFTEQTLEAFGMQLTLKDPQTLQQQQIFNALMQTPQGKVMLPQAMQQVILAVKASGGPGQGPGAGAPPGGAPGMPPPSPGGM